MEKNASVRFRDQKCDKMVLWGKIANESEYEMRTK